MSIWFWAMSARVDVDAESIVPNSSGLAPRAKEERSGEPVMERLANGTLGDGRGAGDARVDDGRDRGSVLNGETGDDRAVVGAEEEVGKPGDSTIMLRRR